MAQVQQIGDFLLVGAVVSLTLIGIGIRSLRQNRQRKRPGEPEQILAPRQRHQKLRNRREGVQRDCHLLILAEVALIVFHLRQQFRGLRPDRVQRIQIRGHLVALLVNILVRGIHVARLAGRKAVVGRGHQRILIRRKPLQQH
jgi:hypothetical protein